MYTMNSHVRYSEADHNGLITPDALINYFQDCTMVHSELCGRGVTNASKAEGYWFLASWQADIIRTPKLFENINITTIPYEFKGFFGSRNFLITTDDGEELVKANSVWIYLDSHTHSPARIPKEEGAAYGEIGPKLDMEYLPSKIKVTYELTPYAPVPVDIQQIDTNEHVNNCEYIRTFMSATGAVDMPRRIRAEYRQAAVMGDIFHPYVNKDDARCIADLRGEDGTSYAVVEFIYEKE